MSNVDIGEVRDSVGDRDFDAESVHEGDQLLAFAEFVAREGDRSARELHLEPVQQVGLDLLLRREAVPRASVRRIDDQALDEFGPGLPAGRAALRVEVPRVEEIVDSDHRGAEHVPRVLQHDAESVQIDFLAEGQRMAGAAAADLEDVQGLGRHDPARRQMVHVTVADDAPRRLAHGIEDDFLQEVLDEEAAFVPDAHQDLRVNTYRVGTRRLRPVQYLQRSHR